MPKKGKGIKMRISEFLKDRLWQIVLLLFAIITIEIFLLTYKVNNFIRIYIFISIIASYVVGLLFEYYKKKKFYENIKDTINNLKEKYLITELIENPDFIEGKEFMEIVQQIDKSMHENVNKYKYLSKDYKEYIELWIHEIKTPIATMRMIIENNKNEVTKSIEEELKKLENYIEQTLYYARSNTVEKDYYIRKCNLRNIVNECIKKNKNELIQNKIIINVQELENLEINTDSKWVVFILNQIIQNSIKYGSSEIKIYSKQNKENIILCVKDNGIGIKENEIKECLKKVLLELMEEFLIKSPQELGYIYVKNCVIN